MDGMRVTAAGLRNAGGPVRTMLSRYWIVLTLPVIGLLGWFGGQPVTITLIFAAIWAMFAVGYDLFSGYSGRINLGYAMFPGVAAYMSAALSVKFGWSLWLSIPTALLSVVLLALLIGVLTLRIRGIYFAVSTSIVPLALFQLTHIFGKFFGGEEGIWGVPPFFSAPRYDLVAVLGLLAVTLGFALWFVNSKTGLELRAIRGGDLTAQALGIDTFRFLLFGFVVSAVIGGIGGVYFGHFQMFVGPDLLFIVTTLQIITFSQVGGPATIVGPAIGSFALVILNEYLRAWSDVRLFAYFVVLVLLLRFAPDGVIVPAAGALRRMLGRVFARG